MKLQRKRQILYCLVILIVLALTAVTGVLLRSTFMDIRQREVKQILHFYSDNIMLQLHGNLNEADTLAQMALTAEDGNNEWFEKAAAPLLEKEEVRYVCLVDGDIMDIALPKDRYGSQVGHDLKDFSYVYTMAKVVKELVVEGPVIMESDTDSQEVFLFLQPIIGNGAYLGEVVVALDRDFVLQQFGLDYLADQGYDYELWRVDPQNGNKEVVAVSQDGIDFSHAAKTTFYLPTQWNLSIQPTNGWISSAYNTGIAVICSLTAILLLLLACSIYKLFVQKRILTQYERKDGQTGLYNQVGFTEALDQWKSGAGSQIILFYFVFEGYGQVSQAIGLSEEAVFLKSIPGRLEEFIENPFIAGYFGSGHFAVAVREDMNDNQQEDFAKGLSLELLMKVRLYGEKSFLNARYQYIRCSQGRTASEEIAAVIRDYYMRQSKESPVRMLTEKCRMLIEGQNDVVFDEYTDLEMMELSKTFNQYRKQVEQMAYTDPMFHVGNRRKYLRDANMLISYDQKRRFRLFCVDICSFSQYNELFSADIGDQILREVLQRLSHPFGTYLYRINGDVFLGISMSGENEEIVAARLQQLFSDPVSAGNASFALQVRIAVCEYPAYGDTPEVLLDRIQTALRFAKESNQKIMVYSHSLDRIIRTEADILRRLKSGIQQRSLEVWYQPLCTWKRELMRLRKLWCACRTEKAAIFQHFRSFRWQSAAEW
ncbi:GGDEF domain-containing protein [Clostridium sp. AM58-1XD]|uniref:sensor domain-containing diguanylate cyclase n=1 Tax=Clostridium sp. AM58-1XD TaxID=2292307 RepID=UPI001FA91699|nr:GGDEF domain-containing protein [Clostridium sp. AM58-1XD]